MVYRPTARLLALLELLQAHDRLGGAELARRLEVDARSVRRYIETLQDLGIPVEAARGPYGGYRLRPGYKLPPLMFTDEEAVALSLALAGVPRLGLALAPAVVEGARAKLGRALPPALRERARALEASVEVSLVPPEVSPGGGLVALLADAAHRGRAVRIHYRRSNGACTERTVEPYGVARWSSAWYLVGHCHLRAGPRIFRLDRVDEARPLDQTFTPLAKFEAAAYVARAMAAYPGRWEVELTLSLPVEEAARTTLAAYGALEPVGDATLFRGRFDDLPSLSRWLATLGCGVSVHRPPELREALGGLARQVAAMAADHDSEGHED